MSVYIYSANVPCVRRLTDASLQMRLSVARRTAQDEVADRSGRLAGVTFQFLGTRSTYAELAVAAYISWPFISKMRSRSDKGPYLRRLRNYTKVLVTRF